MLIERDRELGRIEGLLAVARDGRGGVVVVEGKPGIGKTALLAAARARASEVGIRALLAVAGELEQDLPFAVVRQLFEPVVRAADAAAREDLLAGAAGLAAPVFGVAGTVSAGDAAAMSGIMHGLYWVCSNLAERSPILLAIDDAHWSDGASLRFVSYLARRIADLPVLLVLASRPQPAGDSIARALSGVAPDMIRLRPLSDQAVGQLVREAMSGDADDAFCLACARASGGNPFLLAEALTSLRADHVRPVAVEAARVESLRPETIKRAVLTRLARLGPAAGQLARALAVLGPAAEVRHAARLAGLQPAQATEICEMLAREDIITSTRPVEFVHPLVRSAIYADASEVLRAAAHKHAALILAADGVPAEQLVPHLLAAEPEADPQVVGWLRAAAASALARGAPEVAAACLQRALAEPAAAPDRLPVLAGLGRAIGMADRPSDALDALRAAGELAQDLETRAELAMELWAFMVKAGRADEAMESFRQARSALGGGEAQLLRRPNAAFVIASFTAMEPPATWIGTLEHALAHGDGDAAADRMLLAALAFASAAAGDRTANQTAGLAARAAQGPLPATDRWVLVNFAGAALAIADQLPAAIDVFDRGIDAAQRHGDAAEYRYLRVLRSHTALYAGRLLEAEADGRAALALHDSEPTQEKPLAAAVLIDALTERGSLAEAEAILVGQGLEKGQTVNMLIDHFVLMARGRLRLRQNRPRDAVADLQKCGDLLARAGYTNPAFAWWRSETVLARLALGETSAAHALAAEELELARRYRAPHATGIALRAAGLAESGPRRITLLEESVSELENSGAILVRAHSLIDYGAALRRAGHRAKAADPLRHGLDLAARCGARPLAKRANEELTAAGARPRRDMLTGPGALTASEQRVARLAADGATNREIAQALFLSLRTVEIHLTSTYRKLRIDSRHQLKETLTAAES